MPSTGSPPSKKISGRMRTIRVTKMAGTSGGDDGGGSDGDGGGGDGEGGGGDGFGGDGFGGGGDGLSAGGAKPHHLTQPQTVPKDDGAPAPAQ